MGDSKKTTVRSRVKGKRELPPSWHWTKKHGSGGLRHDSPWMKEGRGTVRCQKEKRDVSKKIQNSSLRPRGGAVRREDFKDFGKRGGGVNTGKSEEERGGGKLLSYGTPSGKIPKKENHTKLGKGTTNRRRNFLHIL